MELRERCERLATAQSAYKAAVRDRNNMVRAAVSDAGLSMAEVAGIAGISQRQVANIVNGRANRQPRAPDTFHL